MTNKINGIDVSECGFCCWKHNGNELIENYCAVFNNKCICNPQCYFKQLRRLQEENEKIKNQYNCYACGNCNGKEDYINLEKHHKGLRKQFDELVKRNNTLSLRIEELEKENEKLKEKVKDLDAMTGIFSVRLANKYKQALEEIREDLEQDTTCESRECGCDDYGECLKCVKETILDKISEVLNDRN